MPPEPFATPPAVTAPLRPIHESYWVIPGNLLAGEYPAVTFSPEVTQRRLSAFLDARFTTFINLTSSGEVEDYSRALSDLAAERGLAVSCLRFPINDYSLPAPASMRAILDALDEGLKAGQRIYLHCYGGIGRTGTVVGCYLVRHGYSGSEALEQLATWWRSVPKSIRFPNSPETLEQDRFVLNWQES